jgi:EAL domain-containing protein (putative c-di-GMP-specific phosphodiesterase class I)
MRGFQSIGRERRAEIAATRESPSQALEPDRAEPASAAPSLSAALRARRSLEASAPGRPWPKRLRRALDEDLFALQFQPIVPLGSEGTPHHEALLRLADESGGRLVSPGAFLPAAERHGLIREIDRMVVDRVAGLLGSGRAPGPIAVNVSALSIVDSLLLVHLQRALDRHGADPADLIVEITETTAITDMSAAASFCTQVQRLGCAVALDDFGAGFGSFQYLKALPFTYLKIDGGFVRALPSSRVDQLVVRALVSIVRGMGRLTVAEFVGDEPTLEMLRSYGVDYAQGYAVGPPGPLPRR